MQNMPNLNLIKFVKSLNTKEARLVEDYIQSVNLLSGNIDESKQLKLFRFIIDHSTEPSEKEISGFIGTKNISSLKYHLSEKIFDALCLNKYISDTDLFNAHDIEIFSLKKKMLLAKMLMRTQNQGKTETIEFLLEEIIKKGKEIESYDI